jgi:hypothetical protein
MMNGRVGDIQTKVVEVIQDSIAQPKHTETAAAANSALDRNMHAKNAAVIEIIPAQKSLQANIALVYAQVQRNEFVNQDIRRGQLKAVTTHLLNQVSVGSLQDTSRFVMNHPTADMPCSYRLLGSPHPNATTNFQPQANFLAGNDRFSVRNGISDMNVMNQSLLLDQEIAEHGKQLVLLRRLQTLKTMYPHWT